MKATDTDVVVCVTENEINAQDHIDALNSPETGAVAAFFGVVRASNDGRKVAGIHYECYREMARRECEAIIAELGSTAQIHGARIAHRVGDLVVGDLALLVVVSSAHRRESFRAVEAVVEELKKRAPIWKKERYSDGTERWL